jgi:hypothetical protein
VQNLVAISTRGPPVLPPWRWKFGLLLSRNVHTIVVQMSESYLLRHK